MKIYEGKRTIDGLVVTVDGQRLDESYEVKCFSKYGFEQACEGASPQQLAAILVDHLDDTRLSQPFMQQVVTNFDNDWALSGDVIDAALRQIAAWPPDVYRGLSLTCR